MIRFTCAFSCNSAR